MGAELIRLQAEEHVFRWYAGTGRANIAPL
jgi:hypothetical protein